MPTEPKTTKCLSRTVLALSGPDRFAFLQGLVSNDMRLAEKGETVFTALLTPQGKYLFDFIVHPYHDFLLLDCEAEQATNLAKRLAQFTLRAQVQLAQTNLAVYALWNGSAFPPNAFTDPRHPKLGKRLFSQTEIATSADESDYINHRYTLGIAEGNHEIIANQTILLEANFDLLNGVSFEKGCYMGQEVTARTFHRGTIKKRYLPFAYDGLELHRGMSIRQQGFEIGEIQAFNTERGLGLFNLERVKPFIDGNKPIISEGVSYTVTVPDYLKKIFE